MNERKV